MIRCRKKRHFDGLEQFIYLPFVDWSQRRFERGPAISGLPPIPDVFLSRNKRCSSWLRRRYAHASSPSARPIR